MNKRDAKARVKTLATSLVAIGQRIADDTARHVQSVGEQLLSAAVLVSEGADLHEAHNLGDWREWSRKSLTGAGVSVGTMYRVRNAGTVARVADNTGDLASDPIDWSGVSYLALVPFYKVLAGAKSADEKSVAETLVRELVAKGFAHKDGLTAEVAEDLVSAIPSTRGANAGDADSRAKAREAAKKRRAARTAAAVTPPPTKTEEDDSAAREACSKAIGRILKPEVFSDESLPGVKSAMVAAAKLCEQYNPSTVIAIVKGFSRS